MPLCTEIKKGRVKGNKYFRCKKRDCSKKLGFHSGTFFEKTSLSLKDVFCLSSYSAKHRRLTAAEIILETGSKLSFHTLVEYMNCFRDVCTKHFRRHLVKIGGPGKVVEIDETLLSSRKYSRGRVVEKQWCFGGIERGTNNCFVVPVERRDAATVLPLIRQYVVPGTTIVSDQWAAYSTIKEMPEGYQHKTVNHSLHFVDPETGAYTSLHGGNLNRGTKQGMGRRGHFCSPT